MDLQKQWQDKLKILRKQGMSITDINPVSALAEMIDDDIYEERVSRKDIQVVLKDISKDLWRNKASDLRYQTGLNKVNDKQFSVARLDIAASLSGGLYCSPNIRPKKRCVPSFGIRCGNRRNI